MAMGADDVPGADLMDKLAQDAVSAIGRVAAVPMILDVVCRMTGMGCAAVARVTEERWIACSVADHIAFGLRPGEELAVETTICSAIRKEREPVVIEDAETDEVYQRHHTPKLYGFRSYVSVPIIRGDGSVFGTLCAIDPQARPIGTPEVLAMFKAFAALIASHLDDLDLVEEGRLALAEERREAGLREEFIAVLGHDLRNPLQAIASVTGMLRRRDAHGQDRALMDLLDRSVDRMTGLIDDVLDFARGRLGSGLTLVKSPDLLLAPLLCQVLNELRVGHPERVITARFDLAAPVSCDGARIGQLLSNLVANALTHGAQDGVVSVTAAAAEGGLVLEVSNPGPPIPEAAKERLFEPFFRNAHSRSQQGLGLGLYIARMVAEAHGGTLEADSSEGVTRFTLRVPTRREA